MVFRTCALALTIAALTRSTSAAEPLVLSDVTVFDGTGAPAVAHRDVLPRAGRIEAIVPHGTAPPGDARVLSLPGRFVLPGLIDTHVHLLAHPWDEHGELQRRWDRPSVERFLRLLLAFGVTTVRDPGSETEAAVTFRKMQADGRLLGPAIVTAGRIVNGSTFDPEPFQPVTTVADVQREVTWQADAGVDWIKLYGSLPPDLARAAIEAAHARGLPVVGHLQRTTWTEAQIGIDALTHAAPWSADLLPAAARAGYRGDLSDRVLWLEQVDPDGPAVTQMIATLREHNVTLDPTLIAMHTKFFGDAARWRASPDLALMPALHSRGWPAGSFTASWTAAQYARAQKAWPRLEALIRRYHAAGVRLTTGTDAPTPWIVPGASLHEEFALLVDAGLPATDVLQMATSAGAQALRRADRVGTLRLGLQADVVVLSADPLADIHNTRRIEWVVQAGVAHRPADLLAP